MQYFTRGLPLQSGQQKQLYYAVPVASAQEVTAEGIVATQLESSCYQGNATSSTMSEKMHTMMLGVSILTILPILSTNEAKDASVQMTDMPWSTLHGLLRSLRSAVLRHIPQNAGLSKRISRRFCGRGNFVSRGQTFDS
ncbi:uncharacterized protein LOC144112080 isoform X1 [Amblyomma americanum]